MPNAPRFRAALYNEQGKRSLKIRTPDKLVTASLRLSNKVRESVRGQRLMQS
jgi:hypothetical protein